MRNKFSKISLCLLMLPTMLVAQRPAKDLDTVIVKNIGSYNVTITDAEKIKENPQNNDTTKVNTEVTNVIFSQSIVTSFIPEEIRSPKMQGEKLPRLYKGWVKAGIGNYSTPLLEAGYSSARSKDFNYGINFGHRSSYATLKNKGYSGYSINKFGLFGEKYIKHHTVEGNFNATRNVFHCYGYNTDGADLEKDFTANYFAVPELKLLVKSHYVDSTSFHHNISAGYTNLADNHSHTENNFKTDASVYTFYQQQKIFINVGADYNALKSKTDTLSSTLVYVNPGASYNGKKFNAAIGVAVYLEAADNNRFAFYPNLFLSYNIADNIIIPYLNIDGKRNRNSYRALSHENPFVKPIDDLRNTELKYRITGGLKGSLSSKMHYNTFVEYSKQNNALFFVNDFSEVLKNRFTVVYDSIHVFRVHGEIEYRWKEKWNFIAKADYYRFDMNKELRAWHSPGLRIAAMLYYSIQDKIIVKAEVYTFGKQFATPENIIASQPMFKELKGYTDVNLCLEYRLNHKFSAFIEAHNLAGFRYEKWQNYTSQRLNAIAGVTYSF